MTESANITSAGIPSDRPWIRRPSPLVANLAEIARLVIGATFVLAGCVKLFWPYDFLHAVYAYELFSRQLGLLLAVALPWMELILGVCLLSKIGTRVAAAWCGFLLSAFVIVQMKALSAGLEIDCGCGPTSTPVSGVTVLRTSLLTIVAGLAFLGGDPTSLQDPCRRQAFHRRRRHRCAG